MNGGSNSGSNNSISNGKSSIITDYNNKNNYGVPYSTSSASTSTSTSSTYYNQIPSAPYLFNENNYYNNVDYYNNNSGLTNEIIKDDELFLDIFPRKKKSEFLDIPTIGKIFLICVFLELVFGFSMVVIRFANWNGFDDNVRISIIGLACSIFLFYYSFDSIWKENKFQLFSFIVIMCTISLGGAYQFYHIWSLNTDVVNSIRFISVLVFIPLNITLGIFSYKKFGWKLYRKIGTSIELRKLYKNYQIFLSLLKIDVFITAIIVANQSLFYLKYTFEIYINVTVFFINFLWNIVGYHSIKKENKTILKVFIMTSWLLVAFNVWKMTVIILDIINGPNGKNIDRRVQFAIPILLFCIISLINRMFIIFYSLKAFNNFDKGLKIVFEKEKRKRSKSIIQQQIVIPPPTIVNK